MDLRRPNLSAPPVYRPFKASTQMKPVAPPVYRPQAAPRSAPKPAILGRFGIQPRMETGVKIPSAPPVYKPYQKPITVQPKTAAPPVYRPHQRPLAVQAKAAAPPIYRPHQEARAAQPKIALKIRAAVLQMSSKRKRESKSGFSACGATVESATKTGTGSYAGGKNIHAEIAALEDYLGQGGELDQITTIKISSPPCKYCHFILIDLRVRGKVADYPPDCGVFGSCAPGSYGWFNGIGRVSKALQTLTGKPSGKSYEEWEKEYTDDVIARKNGLKKKK